MKYTISSVNVYANILTTLDFAKPCKVVAVGWHNGTAVAFVEHPIGTGPYDFGRIVMMGVVPGGFIPDDMSQCAGVVTPPESPFGQGVPMLVYWRHL